MINQGLCTDIDYIFEFGHTDCEFLVRRRLSHLCTFKNVHIVKLHVGFPMLPMLYDSPLISMLATYADDLDDMNKFSLLSSRIIKRQKVM